MRLHRLTLQGPYAFPAEVTIDFDKTESLVSISGPNGAGKSTVMDAIMAVFCGEMPSRPGALYRNWKVKGYIRLLWSMGGHTYHSSLSIDPVAQRTEATLSRITATPDGEEADVLAGPLIRDYRRRVLEIVGPTELLLAAMYSVQNGSGAFLRLPRPERKGLLTDLLGLQVYPRWHEVAKGRLSTVEAEWAQITTRIETLTTRTKGKAALIEAREDVGVKLDTAEIDLHVAHQALDEARQDLETARRARADLEPVRKHLATTEVDITTLRARITEAEGRKATYSTLLQRANEVRAAADRDRVLRTEVDELDIRIEAARTAHQLAVTAAHGAQVARERASSSLTLAERSHASLGRQASLLGHVPCKGEGEYAACQFLKDARAASEQLPIVTAEIAAAQADLGTAPVATVLADPTTALTAGRTSRLAERQRLAPTVAMAADLAVAIARLDEVDRTLTQDRGAIEVKRGESDQLRAMLDAIPALDLAVTSAETAERAAAQRRDAAQKDVQALSHAVGQLDGQLQAVLAAETEADDLRGKLAPVAADVADWALITKGLSPVGIPALKIDIALPEIGQLATDLLRECFGESVFTIQLTTQRESADGAKMLETLDVVVSRGGEPIDATLLSGGESVLVAEALSLAIALYSATRSGRRIQTLMRDEVSAPLDITRGPAYVRMLRRAAQLGSFRHVLFVSHQPACLELADARIEVRDGKVTVQ